MAKENINRMEREPTTQEDIFADISSWTREIKEKNKQMGLHQIKKLLHS